MPPSFAIDPCMLRAWRRRPEPSGTAISLSQSSFAFANSGRFETVLRRAILLTTLSLPCIFGLLTTYVLVLLLALAVGYFVLGWGRLGFSFDLPAKLFLIAWGLFALTIIATARTPVDYGQIVNFGMLALYAPLASLFRRAESPHNGVIFARLALAGTSVAFLLALVEMVILQQPRALGLASDTIRFSDTALILGFLAPAGILLETSPRRWLYLLGPVLGLVVVLMSGSRSGILAFPFLVIAATLMLVRHKRKALAIGAAGAAGFAGLLALASTMSFSRSLTLPEILKSLLTGGVLDDESVRQRLALYRAGLTAFWRSPWLGYGWRNRMVATSASLSPADPPLADLPHLHNEVLNFAVGSGVLGIVIYILLMAIPIYACLKSPRDSQYLVRLNGCGLLVVSYVASGITDVMVGFELHTALYVAWTAILLSYCRDPASRAA